MARGNNIDNKNNGGEDDVMTVSPVEAYVLTVGMLNNFNCGAVPSERLPETLQEDQKNNQQLLDKPANKLSIWAPKDRF